MFAPADIPSFIQTVHGLEYKVTRTSRHDAIKESKAPQKPRRTASKKKAGKPHGDARGG